MKALLFLIAVVACAQGPIREEQSVEVKGVLEVWRLQWKSPPKPGCEAGPGWYTCPCAGFSFGESGKVDLVRLRQGKEVERLALTPLFEGDPILQRWPTTDKDMDDPDTADPATVARRPVVRLMNFADYDHDGHATEFYLQTSAGPCGHIQGVVIGVSASDPQLHAFRSRQRQKMLVLQRRESDALLKGSGPVHVVDFPCGDHGENKQIELQLQPGPRGIDVTMERYACPRLDNARPLMKEAQ
jgi:hypothetical protein